MFNAIFLQEEYSHFLIPQDFDCRRNLCKKLFIVTNLCTTKTLFLQKKKDPSKQKKTKNQKQTRTKAKAK
jgi:hypothetical protein